MNEQYVELVEFDDYWRFELVIYVMVVTRV